MRVLVTGGAGYIGSFLVHQLHAEGHEVIVLDDLSQGHAEALPEGVQLLREDLVSGTRWKELEPPEVVVHLAARTNARESARQRQAFFRVNALGTRELLRYMDFYGVRRLVFASSAAVYGRASLMQLPLREEETLRPISVYGQTKKLAEDMIYHWTQSGRRAVILRIFNVGGARADGELGEDHEPEFHFIPRAIRFLMGLESEFYLYNGKLETPDGYPVRDFVHVEDVARAFRASLDFLLAGQEACYEVINIGSGVPTSMLDIFQRLSSLLQTEALPERRPLPESDPPALWADTGRAQRLLNWTARKTLQDILRTAILWHRKHPRGF